MSVENEVPADIAMALRRQGRTALIRCGVASAIVLVAVVLSILGDVKWWPNHHLVSRAGAWIAGLGGYITYAASVAGQQLYGNDTELADYYISPRLAKVGMWLLVIGTLDWAYGDLFY